MQDILKPQDLAKKTIDDIIKNLKTSDVDHVLAALQIYYDIANKTQELQIEYLSEFTKNLKNLQHKDKKSLDNLKQQVLSHILNK